MGDMAYRAPTYEQIRKMSRKELVEHHDEVVSGSGPIESWFWLQEIGRRDSGRQATILIVLTIAIAVLTAANVWLVWKVT
jgi:hypothetical protein